MAESKGTATLLPSSPTLPHKGSRVFRPPPKPETCRYQSFYCEENIWHLCQHADCQDSTVIFIASRGDMFPMLCQKAMPDLTTPMLWDYHVILLLAGNPARILDFDTTLPFCTDLSTYFSQSFLDESTLIQEFVPYFRLISAKEFISEFHSDRSHMKTADGWNAPPPDWPLIGGNGSNLTIFTNMDDHSIGEVLSRTELLQRYS